MYIYFRMAKRRGCKRNTEINCCVFFRSSLYFPIFPKLSKRKFSYQLINYKFFYRKHGISFKFQFTGWPLCYHLSCNLWPLRHTPLASQTRLVPPFPIHRLAPLVPQLALQVSFTSLAPLLTLLTLQLSVQSEDEWLFSCCY